MARSAIRPDKLFFVFSLICETDNVSPNFFRGGILCAAHQNLLTGVVHQSVLFIPLQRGLVATNPHIGAGLPTTILASHPYSGVNLLTTILAVIQERIHVGPLLRLVLVRSFSFL